MAQAAADTAAGPATLEPPARPQRTGPGWVRVLVPVVLAGALALAGCPAAFAGSSSSRSETTWKEHR
jgi:hypothetical protein